MEDSNQSINASGVKISIAMAVYNGEKYLETQLSSIVGQSLLPSELVVCDDLSTDNSRKILQEFSEKAPFPVKIIYNEKNEGYVSTFSKALGATSGDLIFLCDQDDFWFENKIQEVYAFSEAHLDFLVILNNAELTDGNLSPKNLTTFEQMGNAGQNPEYLVLGCCMAIRKKLLNYCFPIPADFSAHDVWINEFAAFLNSKILLNKSLQYYRRHQKNESSHIIYSLEKITTWDYKLDYFKKLFWKKSASNLVKRLSDNEILLKRYKSAKGFFPSEIQEKLESKISELSENSEILKDRLDLLNFAFLPRIKESFKLLREGRYSKVSGFGSFLKDVFRVH